MLHILHKGSCTASRSLLCTLYRFLQGRIEPWSEEKIERSSGGHVWYIPYGSLLFSHWLKIYSWTVHHPISSLILGHQEQCFLVTCCSECRWNLHFQQKMSNNISYPTYPVPLKLGSSSTLDIDSKYLTLDVYQCSFSKCCWLKYDLVDMFRFTDQPQAPPPDSPLPTQYLARILSLTLANTIPISEGT